MPQTNPSTTTANTNETTPKATRKMEVRGTNKERRRGATRSGSVVDVSTPSPPPRAHSAFLSMANTLLRVFLSSKRRSVLLLPRSAPTAPPAPIARNEFTTASNVLPVVTARSRHTGKHTQTHKHTRVSERTHDQTGTADGCRCLQAPMPRKMNAKSSSSTVSSPRNTMACTHHTGSAAKRRPARSDNQRTYQGRGIEAHESQHAARNLLLKQTQRLLEPARRETHHTTGIE